MSLWNVIFEQNGTPEKWVRNVTCTEEMALLKVSRKLENVNCIEAMSLFLVLKDHLDFDLHDVLLLPPVPQLC